MSLNLSLCDSSLRLGSSHVFLVGDLRGDGRSFLESHLPVCVPVPLLSCAIAAWLTASFFLCCILSFVIRISRSDASGWVGPCSGQPRATGQENPAIQWSQNQTMELSANKWLFYLLNFRMVCVEAINIWESKRRLKT